MFEDSDSSYQKYGSYDPQRDPTSFIFKSKVEKLGQMHSMLVEPSVKTEKAFFGMG